MSAQTRPSQPGAVGVGTARALVAGTAATGTLTALAIAHAQRHVG